MNQEDTLILFAVLQDLANELRRIKREEENNEQTEKEEGEK